MQKRKVYSPEFKLNVVKEYLNGGKSPTQLCEKYSISPSIFFRWLKEYKGSGYDDSIFNIRRGRPKSIISDYSKIPPSFFESAGILKHDDSTDWNDPNVLKEKLDYYEKILLEKDEQLKAALEKVELLKQENNQKSNKQQK
mgnify:FL=1